MSSENPNDNPFIKMPDPYEGMRDSIQKLMETHPQLQEDARLCYEMFIINDNGKKLMDSLEKKYLQSSMIDPTSLSAPNMALYWEGARDLLRGLKRLANEHKQRIEAVK